jgi:hypothetical protein
MRVRRIGRGGDRHPCHQECCRQKNISQHVHECLRFHETAFSEASSLI